MRLPAHASSAALQQPQQGQNLAYLAAGNYLRSLGLEQQAEVNRILVSTEGVLGCSWESAGLLLLGLEQQAEVNRVLVSGSCRLALLQVGVIGRGAALTGGPELCRWAVTDDGLAGSQSMHSSLSSSRTPLGPC